MTKQELTLEDFSAIATWLSEEIGGMYFMDRKSHRNQPQNVHQILYRQPIQLYPEERVILTLFIKHIFCIYCETGKTSGFDWQHIFSGISYQLGMSGYKGTSLKTACWQFTKNFPEFINAIKGESF